MTFVSLLESSWKIPARTLSQLTVTALIEPASLPERPTISRLYPAQPPRWSAVSCNDRDGFAGDIAMPEYVECGPVAEFVERRRPAKA